MVAPRDERERALVVIWYEVCTDEMRTLFSLRPCICTARMNVYSEEDCGKTRHGVRTGRGLYLHATMLQDKENEENEGAVEEAVEKVDRSMKHHSAGAACLHAGFQRLM